MTIHILAKKLDLTPPFKKFVEGKLGTLQRILKNFEKEGAIDCFLEVSRTTYHHKQGDVFYAEIMVRLPGKTIRAEARNADVRIAVVESRDIVKNEIVKYKEKADKKRKN